MPIIRLFRRLFAIVAIGFLVWKCAPWPARTLVFNDQNCQCRIPWNWTLKNNPVFVLEAQRFHGGGFYILAKSVSTPVNVDGPAVTAAIKNRLISEGHEIVSESTEPFEGFPAYAYTMRKTVNGYLIYTHSVNFIAGKVRYVLEITNRDADPTLDSQLLGALNSFSLINLPSN